MTIRADTMQRLWYEWKAADEAWHNALVSAFGKDACNRRYDRDKSKHPANCLKAEAKFDATGRAYKAFMGY